jgi:hypothetical protein
MQVIKRNPQYTGVDRIVSSIGSVPSLIIHSLIFAGFFVIAALGLVSFEIMLLVLTTLVSLEAIYLAIFIQITVNRHTKSLLEVEEDLDEIQEDVEELGEDVEDIQEDIEEIQEDFEELGEDGQHLVREPKKAPPTDAEAFERLTRDVERVLRDLEALKKARGN